MRVTWLPLSHHEYELARDEWGAYCGYVALAELDRQAGACARPYWQDGDRLITRAHDGDYFKVWYEVPDPEGLLL